MSYVVSCRVAYSNPLPKATTDPKKELPISPGVEVHTGTLNPKP